MSDSATLEATEEQAPAEAPAEAPEPVDPAPEPTDLERRALLLADEAEHVAELAREYQDLKEKASDAKKRWEAAAADIVEGLKRLKREREEVLPLFDQKTAPVVSDPAPVPEAWRETPLSELIQDGLTKGIVKVLDEAAIRTLGNLVDAIGSEFGLKVDGIGEAKRTKIDDAIEAFFKRNPRQSSSFDVIVAATEADAHLIAVGVDEFISQAVAEAEAAKAAS